MRRAADTILKRRVLAGLTVAVAAVGVALAQTVQAPSATPPAQSPPPAAGPILPPDAPPEEAPPPVVVAPPPASTPVVEPEPEPEPAKAEAAKVEEPPPPPAKRVRTDVAIIQALDKISAETLRFQATVGRPVRYKNLVFTVRACERSASDEAMEDSIAYVVVESQPRAAPGKPTPPAKQTFRGWMYASSPGLHPLEHPIYDAWLITCRASAPS